MGGGFFRAIAIPALLALAQVAVAQSESTPRGNRHALIIAVGRYAEPRIPQLKGIPHDVESARQIAAGMQVPERNTRVLRDEEASYANIRAELQALAARVRDGDRVFVYYSGHGTRFASPENPAVCREALIPSDLDYRARRGLLTHEDIAADLAPAYAKADKVFVLIDACHSGGVQVATRSVATSNTGEELVPKFTSLGTPEHCSKPSNLRTRSVSDAARDRGAPKRNIVLVASSRPDEVSLDSPSSGGLATSSWRYCSTYADDADGSGALSVGEIAECVQRRISERLARESRFTGQNLVISGNKDFAPAAVAPTTTLTAVPSTPPRESPASAKPPAAPPVAAQAASPARFPLESVLAQADERHVVSVVHPTTPLRIGRDFLDLRVRSSRGGFVYLILQSSDNESTYVLFPNALDQDNRISANTWLALPRSNWRMQSQGPAGMNRLLVMVTDAPRDLSQLRARPAGPFTKTLNDRSAAQALTWIAGTAAGAGSAHCSSEFASRDLVRVDECSDSFGATIVEFVER